jgi:hypothetical protein
MVAVDYQHLDDDAVPSTTNSKIDCVELKSLTLTVSGKEEALENIHSSRCSSIAFAATGDVFDGAHLEKTNAKVSLFETVFTKNISEYIEWKLFLQVGHPFCWVKFTCRLFPACLFRHLGFSLPDCSWTLFK